MRNIVQLYRGKVRSEPALAATYPLDQSCARHKPHSLPKQHTGNIVVMPMTLDPHPYLRSKPARQSVASITSGVQATQIETESGLRRPDRQRMQEPARLWQIHCRVAKTDSWWTGFRTGDAGAMPASDCAKTAGRRPAPSLRAVEQLHLDHTSARGTGMPRLRLMLPAGISMGQACGRPNRMHLGGKLDPRCAATYRLAGQKGTA